MTAFPHSPTPIPRYRQIPYGGAVQADGIQSANIVGYSSLDVKAGQFYMVAVQFSDVQAAPLVDATARRVRHVRSRIDRNRLWYDLAALTTGSRRFAQAGATAHLGLPKPCCREPSRTWDYAAERSEA